MSAFYAFWQNFTTCKDFSWADKHNPASATNRKVHANNTSMVVMK